MERYVNIYIFFFFSIVAIQNGPNKRQTVSTTKLPSLNPTKYSDPINFPFINYIRWKWMPWTFFWICSVLFVYLDFSLYLNLFHFLKDLSQGMMNPNKNKFIFVCIFFFQFWLENLRRKERRWERCRWKLDGNRVKHHRRPVIRAPPSNSVK